MNKKTFIWVLAAAAIIFAGTWLYISRQVPAVPVPAGEEGAVRMRVEEFGRKLDMVSILAPKDVAARAIEENYAPFVSPDILAAWKANPSLAPGRMTSNPHPDRIDVLLVEKEEDGAYTVHGSVVEVTTGSPEVINSYQVSFKLRNVGGSWVIVGFVKAAPRAEG